MKKTLAILSSAVALCLLVSGCKFIKINGSSFSQIGPSQSKERLDGNGILTTKTFEVEPFSSIRLDVPADVTYSRADSCILSVSLDENLLEHLCVSVEDGVLAVRSDVSLRNVKKFMITLSSPILEGLECNGAMDFVAEGPVSGAQFEMNVNGAAEVKIPTLQARSARFVINGAADLDVGLSEAEDVSLKINGAGSACLSGKAKDVSVTLSGAGEVDLRRLSYDHLSKQVNGIGSVIKTPSSTL